MTPTLRPLPLISVADVSGSGKWYQQVLGARSGHGGEEYELLLVDDRPVLQLHKLEIGHHHGTIGDPDQPLGNGIAVWFETEQFDSAVARIRAVDPVVVTDEHFNPNARHREIWIRDPDGYLVVISEPAVY